MTHSRRHRAHRRRRKTTEPDPATDFAGALTSDAMNESFMSSGEPLSVH
jgi:hypothetical protein